MQRPVQRRWVAPLLLALALVAPAGCGDRPSLELRDFWLVVDGIDRPPTQVRLPAALGDLVPTRDVTYRLRAEVEVPPTLAGQPLQLVMTSADANIAVLADGLVVPEQSPSWFRAYRRRGPLLWNLPVEASQDGHLVLELVIEHRWDHSSWIGVAPRLGAAAHEDVRAAAVEVVNLHVNTAAVVVLLLMGIVWLSVYLADRRQRAYLWFAVEALTVVGYPLFVLGVLQAPFGRFDVQAMHVSMAIAVTASLEFMLSFFGLPCRSRLWWSACALVCALPIFVPDPHTGYLLTAPVLVAYLVAVIGYEIYISARHARRFPEQRAPRFILVSWIGMAVLGVPDFAYWLGAGELAGGARLGGLGIALVGFWISMVLGAEHTQSLRQRDLLNAQLKVRVDELELQAREIRQLNTDLQRQIGDRSAQLYAALALTVGGRGRAPVLAPGDVVQARYRVERAIGAGGMGAVYEVTRLEDGRRLALKVAREVDGAALARLAREAQMAASTQHPNLVAVVDVDVSTSGFLYLVMELVDGSSLHDERAHYGDPAWALPLLHQLALGLGALHQAGVVHRDLKPSNVLLRPRAGAVAELKIADFGIALSGYDSDELAVAEVMPTRAASAPLPAAVTEPAGRAQRTPTLRRGAGEGEGEGEATRATRPLHAGPPAVPAMPSIPHGGGLTRTGLLPGTPAYIAPELADGRGRLGPAADMFALGVIAFELLTGQRPFTRPLVLDRIDGLQGAPPPPLSSRWADAPASLATAIDACLSPEPGARPTAAALAELLASFCAPGA